jgi:Ca2+/H+ antiporter
MTAGMIRVLLVWGLLILLGAIEFLASYLPIDRAWRPLIMVPAVMMVLVVAIGFDGGPKGSRSSFARSR